MLSAVLLSSCTTCSALYIYTSYSMHNHVGPAEYLVIAHFSLMGVDPRLTTHSCLSFSLGFSYMWKGSSILQLDEPLTVACACTVCFNWGACTDSEKLGIGIPWLHDLKLTVRRVPTHLRSVVCDYMTIDLVGTLLCCFTVTQTPPVPQPSPLYFSI